MADKNTVLRTINSPGGNRCVDLFVRPDETFGFEEFQRDAEDNRGWFPIGFFGGRVFDSESDALREARPRVAWLQDAMTGN